MALLSKRGEYMVPVDDQSPALWNNFVGDWTRYSGQDNAKYNNGTFTATSTPGSSFSYTFSGSQAWLFGDLSNANVSQEGVFISYPTADYLIDGYPVGPQVPFFGSGGDIIYFQTQNFGSDGTHTVDVIVTTANLTNQFIIDLYVVATGNEPTPSTTPTPTSATGSTNVGAIVGCVIGGIACIAILIAVLHYFLRYYLRRSDDQQARYLEKSNPVDALEDEYRAEPFYYPTATATSLSTSSSGPGPRPTNLIGGSNPPSNQPSRHSLENSFPPQHSHPDVKVQAQTGKVVLTSQSGGDMLQPAQYNDSGIRVNASKGVGSALPPLPNETPLTRIAKS